jgi:hypothetical protein
MSDDPAKKYFTLADANTALQVIRPLVEEMINLRQEILRQQPQARSVVEKSPGNGGGKAALSLEADYQLLDALVRRILEQGVLLRDLNTGLLDFPCLRDGREVYLCWRYNEPEVLFWHETHAGFSGRQPL